MSDPLLGTVIDGRYRLTGIVGKGGMGIVYRASDDRLGGRACAVKLLSGASSDPEEVIRFEREVNIIARLHSSHVVRVLDTGVLDDGRRYIVMELLEGLPLSDLIKRFGLLAPARAVSIARGILAGLAEAHDQGVVHRDLKPANVFICMARSGEEIAKVLDFGIAKEAGQLDQELTAANMLIGTPQYMAPEQFRRQPATSRTDLYAVGLLLYQMLCGWPPFDAETPVPPTIEHMSAEFRIGWLHVNGIPAPLELPAGLWAVVAKLLSKDPAERYADAAEVIGALNGIAAPSLPFPAPGPLVEALPHLAGPISSTTGFPVVGESVVGIVGLPPRRSPWLLTAVSGLVLALGATAAYVFWPRGEERVAAGAPGICVEPLESKPEGATVFMGGKALGVTPIRLERPCREVWLLRIERKGYETEIIELRGRSSNEAKSFTLRAEAAPKPAVRAPSEQKVEPVEAPAPTEAPARIEKAKAADQAEKAPEKPKGPEREKPKAEKPKAEKPKAEKVQVERKGRGSVKTIDVGPSVPERPASGGALPF